MAFPSKIDSTTIVAAAIDLLEREGEAALTLRRVSANLGVAPNALYRYFRSREILVAATADEIARRILNEIDVALAGIDNEILRSDDTAQVRALMAVYSEFANTHPALYSAFMTAKEAAAVFLPAPQFHGLLWLKVIEVLEPLLGRSIAPLAAVTLWSLMHGLWALKQAGRLGGAKPYNIDDFAVAALIRGLRPSRS